MGPEQLGIEAGLALAVVEIGLGLNAGLDHFFKVAGTNVVGVGTDEKEKFRREGLAPVEDCAHFVVGGFGEAVEDFGISIGRNGGEGLAVVLGASVGAEGEGATAKETAVGLPVAAG